MTEVGTLEALLDSVRERAESARVFGSCKVADGRLSCAAKASAEPAAYRVELDAERLYVSLVMQDRWQSESIEADLMHSGDKIEELLEEELAELGHTGAGPTVEHFRSEGLLFTFRSVVPGGGPGGWDPESVTRYLLGYEACFRQLGDMESSDDDD